MSVDMTTLRTGMKVRLAQARTMEVNGERRDSFEIVIQTKTIGEVTGVTQPHECGLTGAYVRFEVASGIFMRLFLEPDEMIDYV